MLKVFSFDEVIENVPTWLLKWNEVEVKALHTSMEKNCYHHPWSMYSVYMHIGF
jgi:hypothetical protein